VLGAIYDNVRVIANNEWGRILKETAGDYFNVLSQKFLVGSEKFLMYLQFRAPVPTTLIGEVA
jgi:hypothetical protein